MSTRVKWFDRQVRSDVERRAVAGLRTGGQALAAAVRAELSTTGSGGSAAGRPPHRRSGKLAAAVDAEPTDHGVIVGVTERSEFGRAVALTQGFTGRNARGALRDDPPRPFVGPAVERQAEALVRAAAEGR